LTNITMEQLHTENAWIMAMTLGAEKYDYVPQDLTNAYNMDAFKFEATSKDSTNWWAFLVEEGQLNKPTFAGVPYTFGSFADGDKNAVSSNGGSALFAADTLEAEPTYDGVPYRFGPVTVGAFNAVRAIDDTSHLDVPVTRGYYDTVHLLMSRPNGNDTGKLWLCFTDGTRQEAQFSLADWVAGDTANEVYRTHRYQNGEMSNTSASIYHVQVDVAEENRGKVLKMISMAGQGASVDNHLFAVTLYGTEEDTASFHPLSLPYNVDMFMTAENTQDYNNGKADDGSDKFEWEVFSADGLNASQNFGGVPYTLGSFAVGENNALRTDRALSVNMEVTPGYYQDINFLYTCSGNEPYSIDLYFEDGTVQQGTLGDLNDNGVMKGRDWGWGSYANTIAIRLPIYQGGNLSNDTKIIRTGAIDIAAENQQKILVGMRMVGLHNKSAWIFAATAYGVTAEPAADFVPVELPFNADGFSTAAAHNDGGCVEDGGTVTFSADTFGGSDRTLFGVPYKMGSFDAGKNNILQNRNGAQVRFIPVQRGYYRQAYFMAASTGGANEIAITFHYTDGTVTNGTYLLQDWFNTSGTDVADKVMMYDNGNENDCPLATRMFRLPVDETKILAYVSMSSVNPQMAGNVMLAAMTLQGKVGTDKQFVLMDDLKYNVDFFATAQDKTDFAEYMDTVFSADDLTEELTANGVPYVFGPFADNKQNVISTAHGRDALISLKAGYYDELSLLHTVYGGDVRIDVVLNYEDGTTQKARLGSEYDYDGGKVYDWANLNAATETIAAKIPCWNNEGEDYGSRAVRFTTLYPDPAKKLVSVTLVDDGEEYRDTVIFAMTAYGTQYFDEVMLNGKYVVMDNLNYTNDVFAYGNSEQSGSFDGGGAMFPAEGLEQTVTYGKVPFKFGSFADGKMNAISAVDTVDLHTEVIRGHYNKLYVLYGVYNGNHEFSLDLIYSDGTEERVSLGMVYDWTYLGPDAPVVLSQPYRYERGSDGYVKTDTHVSIYAGELPVNPKKELRTVRMPGDAFGTHHLFGLTAFGIRSQNQAPATYHTVMSSIAYNFDAFATERNSGDGNFDGSRNIFPADGLSRDVLHGGVPYRLGSFEPGFNNGIRANGSDVKIKVPSGRYETLYFLYSMCGVQGSRDFRVKLVFADGTVQEALVGHGNTDWTYFSAPNAAVSQNYRYAPGAVDYDGRPVKSTIELTPVSLFASSVRIDMANRSKSLVSVILPGNLEGNYIFAITGYGTEYVKVPAAPQQSVGSQEQEFIPDSEMETIDDTDQIISAGPVDAEKPPVSEESGSILVWILVAAGVLVLTGLIVFFVYKRKAGRTAPDAVSPEQ
ncbi:MAG: hypothetical protein IJN07_04095, partial [Clostridia bacterium]|nr:hypothetical protein [Clostridia bacterium]